MEQRQLEYTHHGDALVPRQQRFGKYTRSLMTGLGVPVVNQFGLRPATVKGTQQIAPLTINKDLDKLGLLEGVTTFNFHPHLPHYALTTEDTKAIHVLTRQPIDLDRPHPFTAAGNTEFNSFIWMPPNGDRAGDILLADSTIFTTLFGGVESLETFWKNVATMPLTSKRDARDENSGCRLMTDSSVLLHGRREMDFLSKIVPIAMLLFVVSSMLAVGLGLTIPEIIAPLRNVKLVLFALIANFALMPLAAFLIARMLQLDQPLGEALLLLGTAAGAPFLPKLAGVAKSNLAFAVGLMVLLMVLTVAYMPLVLPLLLEGVSVDPMKIARSLLLLMLLPLGAGLAVNAWLPSIAERMRAPFNRISSLSLALLILLLLVTNIQNVISLFGTRGILASKSSFCCGRCWNRVAPRRSGAREKGRAGVSYRAAQYCRCTRGWWQGLRPQSTRHDCRRCRRRATYSHAAGALLRNSEPGSFSLEHHMLGPPSALYLEQSNCER